MTAGEDLGSPICKLVVRATHAAFIEGNQDTRQVGL